MEETKNMLANLKNTPDFLIIGAAKAGTTSIYNYLCQHPSIFMPQNKEPSYFAFIEKNISDYYFPAKMTLLDTTITSAVEYSDLFIPAKIGQLRGEASTIYLSSLDAAKKIWENLPSAKLIVVLRNPIDRAYSHFNHHRLDGYEPQLDFLTACMEGPNRVAENWHPDFFYLEKGLYAEQIKRYQDLFPADQLKVFLYEELKNSPLVVRQIFEYIGVDPLAAVDTNAIYNLSGELRFPWLYQLVRRSTLVKPNIKQVVSPSQWNKVKFFWDSIMVRPIRKMTDKERAVLREYYRDDIRQLASYINRDLSHWLSKE